MDIIFLRSHIAELALILFGRGIGPYGAAVDSSHDIIQLCSALAELDYYCSQHEQVWATLAHSDAKNISDCISGVLNLVDTAQVMQNCAHFEKAYIPGERNERCRLCGLHVTFIGVKLQLCTATLRMHLQLTFISGPHENLLLR
jgi:hypothetical protein